jgi:hypothetical protein
MTVSPAAVDEPAALAALIAQIRKSWPHWGDAERRVVTVTAHALGEAVGGILSGTVYFVETVPVLGRALARG